MGVRTLLILRPFGRFSLRSIALLGQVGQPVASGPEPLRLFFHASGVNDRSLPQTIRLLWQHINPCYFLQSGNLAV